MEKICRRCFQTIKRNEQYNYLQGPFQPIVSLNIDNFNAVFCRSCGNQLNSIFVSTKMCVPNEQKTISYAAKFETYKNLLDLLETDDGDASIKSENTRSSEQIVERFASIVIDDDNGDSELDMDTSPVKSLEFKSVERENRHHFDYASGNVEKESDFDYGQFYTKHESLWEKLGRIHTKTKYRTTTAAKENTVLGASLTMMYNASAKKIECSLCAKMFSSKRSLYYHWKCKHRRKSSRRS